MIAGLLLQATRQNHFYAQSQENSPMTGVWLPAGVGDVVDCLRPVSPSLLLLTSEPCLNRTLPLNISARLSATSADETSRSEALSLTGDEAADMKCSDPCDPLGSSAAVPGTFAGLVACSALMSPDAAFERLLSSALLDEIIGGLSRKPPGSARDLFLLLLLASPLPGCSITCAQ